ncbi:DUF4493 domain-containing protein [Aureibacter tunicatorum]|uniref:Putative carbohydrate metabolism domain-containing protein n=1 Tax=Aureibacter tunicatorum TaxID=866807 RepID=A0AAE3XPA6_9BACT|nr:DUF4493 domain-containing protein [Aureibacter tunicatorum]MDR6239446.1 hypothetical protein [Aureibacter tunicatorum]BDD04631.1 hypothetical protein AUTU_21140 [Aureibacter tunicatorum]
MEQIIKSSKTGFNSFKYLCLAVLFLFLACKDESEEFSATSYGVMTMRLHSGDILIPVEDNKDHDEGFNMDINDFSVEIYQENEVIRFFEKFSDMPKSLDLAAGEYTVEASSEKMIPAIFETPIFSGEKEFEILPFLETPVVVKCSMANFGIKIGYSDKIKRGFATYSTIVSNQEGELLFDKEEERYGFFSVPDSKLLKLSLQMTNTSGEEFSRNFTIKNVEAGNMYSLSIDIDRQGGFGAFNITVNESVNKKEWEFEVPLELGRAPELEALGFDLSSPLTLKEGESEDVILSGVSEEGLKNFNLTVNSKFWRDNDLPVEIDLANLAPEIDTKLKALGIVWTKPLKASKNFQLDLSQITSKLTAAPEGTLDHEFMISLVDIEDQQSDYKLIVNVLPMEGHVETLQADAYAKRAILKGRSSSTDLMSLAFEYKKADEPSWSVKSEGLYINNEGVIETHIENLNPATQYVYRFVMGSKTGEEVQFETEEAAMIPFMDFSTWHMNGSGSRSYYLPGTNLNSTPWRSGDKGSSELTFPQFMQTVKPLPDLDNAEYARMETKEALGILAAGSLFVGEINGSGLSNIKINFGHEFYSRPESVEFDYRYFPSIYDGDKVDQCDAYVLLQVREGNKRYRLATAWLRSDESFENWQTQALNLVYGDDNSLEDYMLPKVNFEENPEEGFYHDKHAKPTHILVVFSSSALGAEFIGGVGSKLDVKNIKFKY